MYGLEETETDDVNFTTNCLFIGDYAWQHIKWNAWFKKTKESRYDVFMDSALASNGELKVESRKVMMAQRDDTPAKVLEKQRLSFLKQVLAEASADKIKYVILFKDMMTPGMQNLIEKHKI